MKGCGAWLCGYHMHGCVGISSHLMHGGDCMWEGQRIHGILHGAPFPGEWTGPGPSPFTEEGSEAGAWASRWEAHSCGAMGHMGDPMGWESIGG